MMHADRVYGALRRFGLDANEADEVAQEVFVRAWRALGRFEERARFSTWLYRIAFNEARRRVDALSRAPELAPEVEGVVPDPAQAGAGAALEGAGLRPLPAPLRAAVGP